MKNKETIIMQPRKTIMNLHYPDGTVCRQEANIWYSDVDANIDIYIQNSTPTIHSIVKKIKGFCEAFGTKDSNMVLTINIDPELHTEDNLIDFLEKLDKEGLK